MQPNDIERKAAETIIERGVRVPLPAPRFLRLFGKKEIAITIHQPTLRTMFTASVLALGEGFSVDALTDGKVEAALELVTKHAKTVCRIVAVHILNGKRKNKMFSKVLANWLMDKLTNTRLLELAVIIVLMSRYEDFTSTIRLFRSMTMTTTAPRNLSPEVQGSQEAEQ